MFFVSKVVEFYQTATCFKLICSQVLAIIPVVFLVVSSINNLKLVHKKIENKSLRKAYHLERSPYLLTYLFCNATLNALLYPVMRVDIKLQTNLVIDILLVIIYLYELSCLMRLEAGMAIIMHLSLCLPIMYTLDKYLDAGVGAVGFFADIGLFCLIYWLKNGNSLAKKYLGIHTIWDLENENMPKNSEAPSPSL